VLNRRVNLDLADVVRARARPRYLDALDEPLRVRKDDRLALECIMGREKNPPAPKSTGCHRFDHHIDVVRVIQMFVRENDSVEFARIAGRNVRDRTNERARTGVDVDLGLPEAHPHAARRAELACHDESRPSGAEKEYGDHAGKLPVRASAVLQASAVTCGNVPWRISLDGRPSQRSSTVA
jgi:hypothetical protein